MDGDNVKFNKISSEGLLCISLGKTEAIVM
jgi:hypothetical protein